MIKRIIHHLSQAEGTLFTTNKMKSIIGKDGCSPGADEILLGTFKTPLNLLTPLQTQYFKNLQWENKIRPTGAPETININDIKEGFQKLKGKTSTSPSNRHPGHYKPLLAADGKSGKVQNKLSSETIRQIITTLINASITLSTPLKRWQIVESIIFEKEKGNSKINRLLIIDNYEEDYNLLLKLYWPKITNNIAEKNNTLGENQ